MYIYVYICIYVSQAFCLFAYLLTYRTCILRNRLRNDSKGPKVQGWKGSQGLQDRENRRSQPGCPKSPADIYIYKIVDNII